jgi:dipeptidyl aminopeptidase/acylaminoacyl peptidase
VSYSSVDALARWQLRRNRHGARRLGSTNLPQRPLALPRRRQRRLADSNSPSPDTTSEPKWSPDGRWIAFLSERKASREKSDDSRRRLKDDKGDTSQIYVISPTGGEADSADARSGRSHTFSWSADSRTIYFATRTPWTKTQKDDYKKQWKDVVQYRTAERGDTIFALDVAALSPPRSRSSES